eukprot:4758992-Amphidinium_carterae.1
MDVVTGSDASFREKRRQHELQEADVLFPDANAKRTKTTEDMVISVLRVALSRLGCGSVKDVSNLDSVGDYTGQVLDLRGIQQSEADTVEREGIKHLILHWDGVAWRKELARECARSGKVVHVVVNPFEAGIVAGDLGSIKGVTTVTEECGQLDV